MSANWIETYVFRDHQYGIEDFDDGQPDRAHFMSGRASPHHKETRYIAWKDGRGKMFNDLEEARAHLRDAAIAAVQENIHLYESELTRLQEAVRVLRYIETELSNDGLGKFKKE